MKAALVLGLAAVLGCGREPAVPEAGPAEREGRSRRENRQESPTQEEATSERADVPGKLRDLHAPGVRLEGFWQWDWLPGYDQTSLRVERTGDSTFALEFLRRTDCSAPMPYATTASWSGTALVLDRPHRFAGAPLRLLYPVRAQGEDCLVPDDCLDSWLPGTPLFAERQDEQFAFRRVEPPQAAAAPEKR